MTIWLPSALTFSSLMLVFPANLSYDILSLYPYGLEHRLVPWLELDVACLLWKDFSGTFFCGTVLSDIHIFVCWAKPYEPTVIISCKNSMKLGLKLNDLRKIATFNWLRKPKCQYSRRSIIRTPDNTNSQYIELEFVPLGLSNPYKDTRYNELSI